MNSQFEALRNAFEQNLAALSLPESPKNLYEPMRYILSLGGKRIRPILTLMTCELYGKPFESAMNQALAVEVFHNFTLLHDDIMDSAEMRRGVQTVHKKWDQNIAILSGDGMMVLAYQLLLKADEKHLASLSREFSNTAMQVCEGQQLDMDYAQRETVGTAEYTEMIKLKTAVLLSGAMKLGAIVADAPKGDFEALTQFAENLGLAFQLRDDFLDAFGDSAAFGKEIGGDIREGKRTWLTIKAFELADESQRKLLIDSFKHKDIETRVANVLQIYKHLKIDELALAQAERFSNNAKTALEKLNGHPQVIKSLHGLIDMLTSRVS